MGAEELLSRVQRALLPLGSVQAALLYGSQASDRARNDSDIDVAVLLDVAPDASQTTSQWNAGFVWRPSAA